MKYLFLIFTLLGLTLSSYSQEEINEFTHASNSGLDIAAGFAVSSPYEEAAAVFLFDPRQIHAYGLNDRFEVISKIEINKKDKKYNNVISKRATKKGYILYLNDKKNDQVSFVTFDFKKGTITDRGDLAIPLKKKRLITSFVHGTSIFFFAIDKKTQHFYLYEVDEEHSLVAKTFDFSEVDIVNHIGRSTQLQKTLHLNRSRIAQVNLSGTDYPSGLAESSAVHKLYKKDDTLILTLDENEDFTQILSFDLNTKEMAFRKMEKPQVESNLTRTQTNSVLHGNYLAQIANGKDTLAISIKDFETGTVKRNLWIQKDLERNQYLNGSYVQKKSWQEENKGLEANQFFRKIGNDDLAVSLDEVNGNLQLRFGSWLRKESSASGTDGLTAMGAAFGLLGALVYIGLYEILTPDLNSYSQHANGKVVYGTSVLNDNLEHLENNDVEANLFDRIDAYAIPKKKSSIMLLFEHEGYTVLGLWNSKFESISFVKFE